MQVLSSRVLLTPTDFARSLAFYRDTLGLHVYREFGHGGHVTGVVLFVGGGLLELSDGGSRAAAPAPAGVRLWLQVPDVDAEVARVAALGVHVLAPPETKPWGLREAEITDPDGLVLVLVQIPPEHPLRRRVD